MTPFVVILVVAFCILPLPTPALPTTHMLAARQNFNFTTRIDADLVFNIAFALALLLALLGRFAWLRTGRTVAQLFAGLNRMCSTFVAFAQRLSDLRFSSLVESAVATIRDATSANTASTPRRGGASYPVATVARGRRVQSGGPGRFGGGGGGGGSPAFTPSM